MCAVSAEREDQLHEQFIAVPALRVMGKSVFAPNLAEFAGPVRQRGGCASVSQVGEAAAVRPVKSATGKPAATKLIISGNVISESPLFHWQLLPLAPDELAAGDE